MPDKLLQLQQVQVGKESTWGTAVAQTRELAGIESLEIETPVELLNSRSLGTLAPSTGAIIAQIDGAAKGAIRANYNQLPILFDSLFGTASPSGGGPYTYAYTAPTTAQPTRSFLTLAKGDGTDTYSLMGALLSNLTLTASSSEWVMLDTEWVGKNVGTDSLDAVSPTEVVFLAPSHLTVSMGAIGGALTALNCDALSVELAINTNTTIRHGLGTITGCDYNYGEIEATLKVTAEFSNATSKAVVEGMLGTAPTVQEREIRLEFANTASYDVQIDFVGIYSEPAVLHTDEDGVITAELSFMAKQDADASASSWCDVTIINTTATMF